MEGGGSVEKTTRGKGKGKGKTRGTTRGTTRGNGSGSGKNRGRSKRKGVQEKKGGGGRGGGVQAKPASSSSSSSSSSSGSGVEKDEKRSKGVKAESGSGEEDEGPTVFLRKLVAQFTSVEKDIRAEGIKVEQLQAWITTTLKPGLAQMNSRLTTRCGELKREFEVSAAPFQERGVRLAPQIDTLVPILDELVTSLTSQVDGVVGTYGVLEETEHGLCARIKAVLDDLGDQARELEGIMDTVEGVELETMEERIGIATFGAASEDLVRVSMAVGATLDAHVERIESALDAKIAEEAERQVGVFRQEVAAAQREEEAKPNPHNPGGHSMATRQAEFFQWLSDHGYEAYFANFKEYGYDTLAVLGTLSDDEIAQLGILKAGHRRGIAMAIEGLRREQIAQQ